MPHYSNLGLGQQFEERKVCRYCGRPIKTTNSLNQGCGDICKHKNRSARYRVIEIPRKEKNREW